MWGAVLLCLVCLTLLAFLPSFSSQHLSLTCTCTYLHVYVQYYRFCSHLQALSTETRQNLFHTFIIHSHTHTSTTHPYHFTHTHTSTTHPYHFTHSHTHTSTTPLSLHTHSHIHHTPLSLHTHSHTTTHPYHFTHTHTSTTHPYHRTLILLSSAPRCAMRRRMLTAGWYSTSCPPHTCPTSSTDFRSLWRLTTKVPNCCTNCRGLPIDVLFC